MLKEMLWRKKIEAIVALLGNKATPSTMTLDIGCHDGYISRILAGLGLDVTGIEINPKAVKKAKISGVNVVRCDAEMLPFGEKIFDCCLLSEILEHLPNPERALKEVSRVSTTNGVFVIVTPNDYNFKIAWMFLFKLKEAFLNRGHLHTLTPRKLATLTGKHGRIIEAKGIPFNLPFRLCLNYAIRVEKN